MINVISTNLVSSDASTGDRWEPSTASGTTWATSWQDIGQVTSFVSAWNGSSWNPRQALSPPGSFGSIDANLAWDSVRNRFVFTLVAQDFQTALNIWYGWSNDASGSSWTFKPTPVFAGIGGQLGWDYPSIGVDASGRIIIGAVKLTGSPPVTAGYFATASTDGTNFSAPSFVAGPGLSPGAQSRVAATNNVFHTFVPTLNENNLPTLIRRYQSLDGVNWSGPFSIGMEFFAAPANNSPVLSTPSGPLVLFYAPLLAASGYTNGLWSVAFQAKNGDWNNVIICTSDRGCGWVNAAPDDEFLAGTSVSGDSGYWVAYLTYSTLFTRQLPLISQAIYFPPGQFGIGATTNSTICPTWWTNTQPRCPGAPGCRAAGDFATIASNPFAGASTPFINSYTANPSSCAGTAPPKPNDLFQLFVVDPPAPPNVPNFRPNFVPIPFGEDVRALGTPNSPEVRGFDPARRHVTARP